MNAKKPIVKKPSRIRRALKTAAVVAGIGVVGFAGAGIGARALARYGPEKTRIASMRFSLEHERITRATFDEVNNLISAVGSQVFFRTLGAAVGAATIASLVGARKGISKKYKNYFIGGGAIGGAAHPPGALTIGAGVGLYKLWQSLPASRKEKIIASLKSSSKPKGKGKK